MKKIEKFVIYRAYLVSVCVEVSSRYKQVITIPILMSTSPFSIFFFSRVYSNNINKVSATGRRMDPGGPCKRGQGPTAENHGMSMSVSVCTARGLCHHCSTYAKLNQKLFFFFFRISYEFFNRVFSVVFQKKKKKKILQQSFQTKILR